MNLVQENINSIKDLCQKHKVKELYAFGSVTDVKKFNRDSDVDLLVEFNDIAVTDYSNNYIQFISSLESLLGRTVDLVTAKYLRNRFFITQ